MNEIAGGSSNYSLEALCKTGFSEFATMHIMIHKIKAIVTVL